MHTLIIIELGFQNIVFLVPDVTHQIMIDWKVGKKLFQRICM